MTDTQIDLVDVIVSELANRFEPRFLAIEASLSMLIDEVRIFGNRLALLEQQRIRDRVTPIPVSHCAPVTKR
jgi:hypothetical protein